MYRRSNLHQMLRLLVLIWALALLVTVRPATASTTQPTDQTSIYAPMVAVDCADGPPPVFGYQVVASYPHDRGAFTQGLVYDQGRLFEGTGLNGQSSIREVRLETGDVLRQDDLAVEYFGEGITIFGDRLIQLTWQSRTGFVYDRDTFEPLREFSYPTEGWGLTHDGTRLIMSDGTATLHFLDPTSFEELGSVEVRDQNGPVTRLNELEYIDGQVYANIWQTDRIARIDPRTGSVRSWIDLEGLLSADERQGADVLNGIAYDPARDRLLVTGKLWPKLFEIDLVPPARFGVYVPWPRPQ
jgi:glutaminyl-peptide cyclotransferase